MYPKELFTLPLLFICLIRVHNLAASPAPFRGPPGMLVYDGYRIARAPFVSQDKFKRQEFEFDDDPLGSRYFVARVGKRATAEDPASETAERPVF